jgi:hypothetical protein
VYNDVVLIETNVDPLQAYKATIGGAELRENEDYTVARSGGDGGWYKYTYTVKKELFDSEGEYKLVASSRDKAENEAYSDIKSAEIAFVVDRSAPVLTVSGLSSGGRYQVETQRVTLIPRDDGGKLGDLKVTVTDGGGGSESVRLDLAGEALLDAISDGGGELIFDIPSGLNQSVRIVCRDVAVDNSGLTNAYDVTYKNVTVSTNAAVIFYANKPLFVSAAAGAVGVSGGGAALIVKLLRARRRLL